MRRLLTLVVADMLWWWGHRQRWIEGGIVQRRGFAGLEVSCELVGGYGGEGILRLGR